MKTNHFFTILLMALSLICCQDYNLIDVHKDEGSISFIYKNKEYKSVTYTEDMREIIADASVRSIYEYIQSLENLLTFTHDDGTIEFFDNDEEFISKYYNNTEDKENTPLTPNTMGFFLVFYDEGNYQGDYITLNYGFPDAISNLTNMSEYEFPVRYASRYGNWNNTISSIKIHELSYAGTQGLIIYEGANFTGKSWALTVLAIQNANGIPYLSQHKISGSIFAKANWDSAISSMRIVIR